MGLIARIDQRRIRNDSSYTDPEPWFKSWLVGDRTAAGTRVNERNALQVSDVYKCVRVISETVACLPKKVFERVTLVGRPGKQPAPTHPLYRLIHDAPNPYMTAFTYFEMGMAYLLTWGNFYSYIERGSRTGRPRGLWPLQPDRVRIETLNGTLWYYVADYEGRESRFYSDEILHIHGLGYDGIRGYSPVRLMMESLGWAKATEQYSARFFGNSARPSGLLLADAGVAIKKEDEDALKASFKEFHEGVDNAHRLMLIKGGVKFERLTMPADEAQFLETKKFQRSDAAGMFRLQPHKIGDLDKATFSNIEHLGIEFATDTITPWAERIEQEFDRLLPDSEQQRFFIECELEGLLRGDTAARTQYYREMFNTGSLSQNEIREKENFPPFTGGDEHWIQLNMMPLSLAKELLTAKNQQSPPTAGTSPNANPPENVFLMELQARVRRAYSGVFRDAVGRLLNRKTERAKAVPAIFRPFLVALGELFSENQDADFIDDYLGAMAERANAWPRDNVLTTLLQIEMIAAEELDRAVIAFMERPRKKMEQIS
jgi:HK97 family phage portal protein